MQIIVDSEETKNVVNVEEENIFIKIDSTEDEKVKHNDKIQ